MAEGLLFSVAEGILGKIGSLALREIGLWWGVKDEIESLGLTVLGVQNILLDAEERQARGDEPVKHWLGQLKEVAYDAEDLLDDFSTEVLRRRVMPGNKVTNQVRLFFSSSNRLAYGLKMGHKIKAIRKRLDDIMRVGERFNFQQRRVDNSTSVMAGKREQTHSSPPKVVVVRKDDEKEIKELLLSENCETNVNVISIVGIGGLGKTTLAQRIYNDDHVKLHFNLRAWACISEDFKINLIIKKILECITERRCEEEELNTLKNLFQKQINEKKYLLVLDDIWNQDAERWCSLIDLLDCGSRGSRVVITTRSKRVAEITSPLPQARYELGRLSVEDSWSLFAQMAFEQVYAPPTLRHEAIGQEIVAKCKGVPLAIRAIGRLMYFKKSILEWESMRSKELTTMDQGETSIMSALKLSYDILPSHLKHCFAYCSLFPKDHEIDVDRLVDLWMAQGYIKLSDPSQCFEDIGREYFMDLLWGSFFQDVVEDGLGNIQSCKMHDLMHDLALEAAGAESVHVSISNPKEVGKKTRHISFDVNNDNWQVPASVLEAKSLRTFLTPKIVFFPLHEIGEGQDHAIFCNLRRLRQFDLLASTTETVPNSIGKLKHLRYLNLSWNRNIKLLPRSITRLQNLQVLNLRKCKKLRRLPKDIKKLVSLKKLEIRDCHCLTHMPRGIGQLTSLERLTRFILPTSENSKRKSGGLGELHDLNKLGGYLSIENLPHHGNGKGNQKGTTTPTTSNVAAANLREKPRLQELRLHWMPLDGDEDIDFDEDDMSLEALALQPHPNLKSLTVENYGGINFANWLSSLTNLVSLWLFRCRKCRSLPALDQFPSLKEIHIDGLTDLEYIDICSSSNNNSMDSFSSLKSLTLSDCPNLKGWRPSSPSSLLPQFQRLSTLQIHSCPNLTSVPPVSPSLKVLEINSGSFKSLEQMLKETISPAPEPSSSSLPSNLSSSLKCLHISNIEHLPEDFLPEELLQTLTSLEYLHIWSCPTLTCLPHAKMLLLTSLKSLLIDNCENLDLSNYDDDSSNSNNNDAILWQGQGLRSLDSLYIGGIPKLVHLPRRLLLRSIVMQQLGIWNCPDLASLPEWMSNLTSLQYLNISNCPKLASLPEWMPNLTSLQHLNISNCPKLASLPEWMPNLTSLQYLQIAACSQLSERCKNNTGEDWPKIAHIPNIEVDGRYIQWDGSYRL